MYAYALHNRHSHRHRHRHSNGTCEEKSPDTKTMFRHVQGYEHPVHFSTYMHYMEVADDTCGSPLPHSFSLPAFLSLTPCDAT